MASRIRRYYYSNKQPKKSNFSTSAANIGSRHIGPNGKIVLKARGEKIDLLGQVDLKKYKGQAVLENKMYNAPIFYHKAPRTDFFCVMHKPKNSTQINIQLRELDSVYTVG